MKVYKIRDRETGLYSSGGSSPSWSVRGKTWNTRGAVSNHLSLWQDCNWAHHSSDDYDNADVVTLELREVETTPVVQVLAEKEDRKKREKASKRRQAERRHIDREKEQARALLQKYPELKKE